MLQYVCTDVTDEWFPLSIFKSNNYKKSYKKIFLGEATLTKNQSLIWHQFWKLENWNYIAKCCTFQIKSSRTTFQIRSSRTKYHKILKPTHSKFLPKHWRMSTDTTRFWHFFQPMTSKLSYLEVQNFVVPEFSWKSMLQKELRHSQLTLYNIRWKSGKYACKTFKM